MLVHKYDTNLLGTDYFVGDLHGCYNELMSALSLVRFDPDKDRLFCTGDLIDRGEDSLKCLGLLEEDWFYCVKGNHEQMMLDALSHERGDLHDPLKWHLWVMNGGDWYMDLPREFELRTQRLADLINDLPNAIQVEDVGLVHAECPVGDWSMLEFDVGKDLREKCMWSRRRYSRKDNWKVRGVKAVVVGHTPVEEEVVLGNHIYIDLGVCFYDNKPFTLYSYDDILNKVKSN